MSAKTKIFKKISVLASLVLFQGLSFSMIGQPLVASAQSPVMVSKSDYGVNTFSWDRQILSSGAISAMNQIGVGMQQFPNAVNTDWTTNLAVQNPSNPVNPTQDPVNIEEWGKILQETNQQGLYIFNYDQAPGWKSGGSATDATQLAQYIATHNIPVSSIVIGDEEYGSWDFIHNLHADKSALAYATNVVGIALAIRAILPNVKIGVSFADGTNAQDLSWDQTVLRMDAPYIDFLSVHSYPFSANDSASTILSQMPAVINQLMTTADQQIAENVDPSISPHLSVWITEWNPVSTPLQLSFSPAYGAAMVESLAAWRSAGASKVFVWSFDGGKDSSANNGTFALVSDGTLGNVANNQLYPSGQAVADFMNAIGSGASLTNWSSSTGFVSSVLSSTPKTFFINTTDQTQTYQYNGSSSITVPATSMASINQSVSSVSSMSIYGSDKFQPKFASLVSSSVSSLPTVTSGLGHSLMPGQIVTLQGSNFGSTQGTLMMSQGQLQGGIEVGQATNWGMPGDWYSVKVLTWTPTSITFQVPDGSSSNGMNYGLPQVGQDANLYVETSNQLISPSLEFSVAPATQATLATVQQTLLPSTAQVSAAVTTSGTNAPQIQSASQTVYPGEWVTLTGTQFGQQSTKSFIHLAQNNINWGEPNDWYHVNIRSWSDQSITFQVPNGLDGSGQTMQAGTMTIDLSNASGQISNTVTFAISNYGASIQSVSSSTPSIGQLVTIQGSGFGTQGYVLLSQNSVNWGAPNDYYKVKIASWTDNQISFYIPDGNNAVGNAMASGSAMIQVGNSQGISSNQQPFTIQ